jgi:hypothetical protein
MNMLEPRYQQMLKDAVDHKRIEKEDYVLENPKLEAVIQQIRFECPEKFHSNQSLSDRSFYDEPAAPRAPVPYLGFVRQLSRTNRY